MSSRHVAALLWAAAAAGRRTPSSAALENLADTVPGALLGARSLHYHATDRSYDQDKDCRSKSRTNTPPTTMLSLRGFRTTSAALAKSFYEMLGVSRGATDAEIKKSYYKLAKKFHPDTNKDDPAAAKKFQEIQRAYDTLRDPQKRSAYDQMGHAAFEQAEAGGGMPGGGAGGPFGAGAQVDPEDLFREFFGGGAGGAGPGGAGGFQGTIFEHIFGGGMGGAGGFARARRGRSIQAALTITFDEAMKGASRVVDPSSLGLPGAARGRPVEISIPPGVDNGFQLRVEGQGMPGPQGTPPGDLLIQIMVLPSPKFERDGFDLYTEAKIDIADAALGTSVDVLTIDGRAEVKVKAGTQSGDRLRMRGYGVPMDLVGQRGRKGDQFVVVKVDVPRRLTERQKELLEEFRGGKAAGPGPGWVDDNAAATAAAAATTSASAAQQSSPSISSSDGGAAGGEKSQSTTDSSSSTSTASEATGKEDAGASASASAADGEKKPKKRRGWFSFGGKE